MNLRAAHKKKKEYQMSVMVFVTNCSLDRGSGELVLLL